MIFAVIWMFIGVAMFSIIMGQFEISKSQYSVQMGDPNKKDHLDHWMNGLKRFNRGQTVISLSLRKQIYEDFNYFILNDRNQYFHDP